MDRATACSGFPLSRHSPRGEDGFLIQEGVFTRVFAALRTVADARCFGQSAFAVCYAGLRSFAAKNFQAVENDREMRGAYSVRLLAVAQW
jgi:hypothetical protein